MSINLIFCSILPFHTLYYYVVHLIRVKITPYNKLTKHFNNYNKKIGCRLSTMPWESETSDTT